MEDLSNSAVIGTFITLILGAFGTVWGLYKNSENLRFKQMLDSNNKLIESKDVMLKELQSSYIQQFEYQQKEIEFQKAEYKDLMMKYFELGMTLEPTLKFTNQALEDIGRILPKLYNHETTRNP